MRPGSESEAGNTTDPDLAKKSKSEQNGFAIHYAGIAAMMIYTYYYMIYMLLLLCRVDSRGYFNFYVDF